MRKFYVFISPAMVRINFLNCYKIVSYCAHMKLVSEAVIVTIKFILHYRFAHNNTKNIKDILGR